MKKLLLLLNLFLLFGVTYSQVGIGTKTPHKSSQLDIISSNKGVLLPRISLNDIYDQQTMISGNTESLLVYNTNNNSTIEPGFYYWKDNKWLKLLTSKDISSFKNTTNTLMQIVDNDLVLSDSDNNMVSIPLSDLQLKKGSGNLTGQDILITNGESASFKDVTFAIKPGQAHQILSTNESGNGTEWIENTQPWYEQNTKSPATHNSQDIYQTGSVAIGWPTTRDTNVKLYVTDAVRLGNSKGEVGRNSLTSGQENEASGQNSIAIGYGNISKGANSFTAGTQNTATQLNSFSLGKGNSATAVNSFAIGNETNATGINAFSIGEKNDADAFNSIVIGSENKTNGSRSTLMGYRLISNQYHETLLGKNNAITQGDPRIIYPHTSVLFQLGNGTNVRRNAITVLNNAFTGIGIIGTEANAKPTEMLDIGSGNVKIRTLPNLRGNDTDQMVVVNNEGVLKSVQQKLINIPTEPWLVMNDDTEATSNTQNIYQIGKVAIGKKTGEAKLDVDGATRFGTNHKGNIGRNSLNVGTGNEATQNNSFVIGSGSSATGINSFAIGKNTSASGQESFSIGEQNITSGVNSIAIGYRLTSNQYFETLLGRNNAITQGDPQVAYPHSSVLLQLGNGSTTRNNALTVLNNAFTGIGIIGTEINAKPTAMLDIGSGNVKVRKLPSTNGSSSDRIVVVSNDGVLKSIPRSSVKNFNDYDELSVTKNNSYENHRAYLYSPSVNLPTHKTTSDGQKKALTQVQRVNLYEEYYIPQFATDTGISSIKSPGAKAISVLPATQLDYYITWYDTTVYTNMSINETGLLSYSIKPGAEKTDKTYMNIAFKIKE